MPEDSIYLYDEQQQSEIRIAKPWDRDPQHFTHVKITAHALLKMLRHARKGGQIEIMGMLLGRVELGNIIVMDSFALPVEGTETRVNAHAAAYEYMTTYVELAHQMDRKENVIGWYHSHPGYGCWLSGIDVGTQQLNQQFQDPWVAIVIDPIRTLSTGKVEIGAFRCYPKNFKPTDDSAPECQTVPMSKMEDFGVHCKKYYSLEISYLKSELDSYLLERLGSRYWYNTLGKTTTNSEYNTSQISDMSDRLEQAETRFAKGGSTKWVTHPPETQVNVAEECAKAAMNPINGLMAQLIKYIKDKITLFCDVGPDRKTLFVNNDSFMREKYGGKEAIEERHRHRYEINPKYTGRLEKEGLKFVGKNEGGTRLDILELDRSVHPYFVGFQYHPENLSRPFKPSPLYQGLAEAGVKRQLD